MHRPNEVVPHFFSRGSYYLTRPHGEVVGVVNSCTHRGFKLVTQRQNVPTQQLVCKLHGCTYHLDGSSVREVKPLRKVDLTFVKGMIFETETIQPRANLRSFVQQATHHPAENTGFTFMQENVTFINADWRLVMEVFLDRSNLKVRNPGLSSFISSDIHGQDHEWHFQVQSYWPNPELQKFFECENPLLFDHSVKSLNWITLKEQIRNHGGINPAHPAFKRSVLFPGLVVDRLPHAMVINQLVPISGKMTALYTQFFTDQISADLDEAIFNAYAEMLHEDHVMIEQLADGRTHERTPDLATSLWMDHFERWCK